MTLAEDLSEWTDGDYAAYLLGIQLGAVRGDFTTTNKHVFWTDNRLGNGLRAALLALVEAGLLERDEADDRYRWGSG
jgi:hypothetical protein